MFRAIITTMRPKQWGKNSFLFAALIFDRKLLNFTALWHTIAGAAIFSMLASAIYIINDIEDLESDRRHPNKKFRPIASGVLPINIARVIALLLVAVSIPSAYLLSPAFALICGIYFILNYTYSKWIKHIPIIDVIMLASFYVLRVAAGVVLVQVDSFSPWLYVVTTLLALFIGFGKRRAEINLLEGDAINHRRVFDGYSIILLDQLITIVAGTTIVTYSLYTFSAPNLPDNNAMMLTIPFVLYGIFRYLYLLQIELGGAPEDVVLTDRPLQGTIILYGLTVFLIFYIF